MNRKIVLTPRMVRLFAALILILTSCSGSEELRLLTTVEKFQYFPTRRTVLIHLGVERLGAGVDRELRATGKNPYRYALISGIPNDDAVKLEVHLRNASGGNLVSAESVSVKNPDNSIRIQYDKVHFGLARKVKDMRTVLGMDAITLPYKSIQLIKDPKLEEAVSHGLPSITLEEFPNRFTYVKKQVRTTGRTAKPNGW